MFFMRPRNFRPAIFTCDTIGCSKSFKQKLLWSVIRLLCTLSLMPFILLTPTMSPIKNILLWSSPMKSVFYKMRHLSPISLIMMAFISRHTWSWMVSAMLQVPVMVYWICANFYTRYTMRSWWRWHRAQCTSTATSSPCRRWLLTVF